MQGFLEGVWKFLPQALCPASRTPGERRVHLRLGIPPLWQHWVRYTRVPAGLRDLGPR